MELSSSNPIRGCEMKVKVKLFGLLKRAFESDNILVKLTEPSKLKDLINKIVEESPLLKNMLLDPELMDPRPHTIILVNGVEISALNGLETPLKDGDEIVLIPVIHGGY